MNQCDVLNWPPSFSGTTYGCTCTCFGHLHLFNGSRWRTKIKDFICQIQTWCFKISLNLELSASFRKHRHEDKGRWCIRQSELDRPKFWKWNEIGYILLKIRLKSSHRELDHHNNNNIIIINWLVHIQLLTIPSDTILSKFSN